MGTVLKFLVCLPLMSYYVLKAILLWFVPKSLRYKDVKGETVLITGAGSGLGRELAVKFSRLGCHVVLADIFQERLEETKKMMISENSGEVFLYQCDVSNRESVYAMAAKISDEVGDVTILVNNAGIVNGKKFLDCPDDQVLKTFEVNVLAHFWTCKAFLPDMMKKNHGHLVTISSLSGQFCFPRLTDYCSSKFAAVGFLESLRTELISEKFNGIKSTVVCPYVMNTGLFDGVKTRILGALTAEHVAEEVISAVRINKEILLVPCWLDILLILKRILPSSAMKVLMDTIGVYDCMDNFTGRITDE